MKRLFKAQPTAEELVAIAMGEIEFECPCDHCLKDCKKENMAWCKEAVYPDSGSRPDSPNN